MIVLGLVGRMAAGKSTVARMFAALGAHVVDADRLAHEVLDEGPVRAAVAARFGAEVVAEDGRIDRRRLAGLVFAGTPAAEAALVDLEAIVHPRVRGRMEAILAEHRRAEAADGTPRLVVLDVPLLVQAGWAPVCDRIVVVECDDAVRRERLAARGVGVEQQAARDRAWARGGDPAATAPHKTVSVDASGDEAYTSSQVGRIWSELRR